MITTEDINTNTYMVTGVSGQDGSIMAKFLLEKGFRVVGICRSHPSEEYANIKDILDNQNFAIRFGDITDSNFILHEIQREKPFIIFNFAAQSHVHVSFEQPLMTFKTNAEAVYNILEAIRFVSPKTRFYQSSTSEMWGTSKCPDGGFDENSIFHPRSPYGVAKVSAHHAVKNYRESYNMFVASGICCNHSSKIRGANFATRKITMGVAKVKLGLEQHIFMGNLSSFRDESHAIDIVNGIYLMMIQESPKDYVLASGTGATIKEMFEYVCELAELKFEDVYRVDERFMRPSDVPYLLGNSQKIRTELGWEPKYSWKALLKEMYLNDLYLINKV